MLYTSVVLAAPDGWSVLVENGEEIFIPGDLAGGEEYRLFVSPAVTLPQNGYSQWFKERIDQDAGKWGEVLSAPQPQQNDGGVMTATYALQRRDGVRRYAHFMGFYGQGKAVYLRIISSDVTTLVARYASGMQQVMKETMPQRLQGVAVSQTASDAPVEKSAPDSTTAVATATKQTSNAASSELKRIDNVSAPEYSLPEPYQALVCDFTENRVNNTYYDYVVLLLKDGTAYKGLTAPPEDLNIEVSRRQEPDRWGIWEEDDDKRYRIKIPASAEKWRPLSKSRRLAPARMGEQLNRYIYKSTADNMGMVGGGGSFTNSWTFLGSGRFTRGRSSLFNSGMMASVTAGTSVYAASYSDEAGDSSFVSGNSPGVGVTSQKKHNDGSNNRGWYSLNGYAMELAYDNGETDRRLFGFCYDDRTQPFFGGTLFWMSKSGPADKLPSKWRMQISLNEERYYVPKELKEGEVFRVVFSPRAELDAAPLNEWFKKAVTQNFSYLGQPQMKREWGNMKTGLMTYFNSYVDAQGKLLAVLYYGAKTQGEYGRFVRITMSDASLNKQYHEQLKPAILNAFRP
ncbi:hypothetical protein [Hahella chejuensis]|uniref:hypothetical protein n=1 Tax=Hahella chejuensis TaxID=158327 RepID=UPI0005A0B9D5|nr:hypothetical protein [Hahella chejuensis]